MIPDQNGERRKSLGGWLDMKMAVQLGIVLAAVAAAWGTSQAEIRTLRERMDELKPLPAAIGELKTAVAVLSTEVRYLREQRTRDPRRDVP